MSVEFKKYGADGFEAFCVDFDQAAAPDSEDSGARQSTSVMTTAEFGSSAAKRRAYDRTEML